VTLIERDPFGRVSLLTDSHGARRLLWDGLTLLEERDEHSGALIRSYAPEGFKQGDERFFYLRDPLGSIVGLMGANGDVVKVWNYDAWGFRVVAWQAEGMEEAQPLVGYAGYLQHDDSGLCLMPARAYSPALRRWLSRDPIGLAGGDTNLYAYVGGDAVNVVDPTGLCVDGVQSNGFPLNVLNWLWRVPTNAVGGIMRALSTQDAYTLGQTFETSVHPNGQHIFESI
jgi:RHS repeat-associated protein